MIDFDLHKTFSSKDRPIHIHVKAKLAQGKIYAIYGKSGVGKTSLLRMLAGLMKPDEGTINIGKDIWLNTSKSLDVKTNKRNVGFLSQEYSLFPNMSVLKNIRYGLSHPYDEELFTRIIEIADLHQLLDRRPASLSGGQQQRVALARAIVRKPNLLLLDEPLSALDSDMRVKLQEEILAMQRIIKTTVVFVSHHLPEVFKMADEVLILENGSITQRGTASQVFMNNTSTQLIGEVLSDKNEKNNQTMTLLIDGQVVGITLKD
ncbi:ABC transporter ATP-binding protein [Reichenbachiella carrageenanivorans]|uniref:ABC transporter ATP-binding protein n=1 Tax=Reichenbachiella carrageenanivorans TaxID=2979869 RepID=A0ABY6D3Z1_9BACT|nr:ABC transporter ATP-binding protein [Reichenbachiella carrageenanivorans]UXX80861.1 ABC transporter ATP-binding protein [Reichenbachiella carrageenanivorans]